MKLLSFFSKLFGPRSKWNGTPEMFLGMVMLMQKKNNPAYSKHEVLQWGEMLQKVIKVNLSPYKDFSDLLEHGTPDFAIMEQVEDKMSEMHQRIDLKKAIYGENVDLGDDDVMTSDADSAVSARKLFKDLSKHINFKEDEQSKLDDL